MSFYKKIRNIAFLIEPEKAHKLAISALKTGIHIPSNNNSELLKQEVFGLIFNLPGLFTSPITFTLISAEKLELAISL